MLFFSGAIIIQRNNILREVRLKNMIAETIIILINSKEKKKKIKIHFKSL